jgi:acetyl esterase
MNTLDPKVKTLLEKWSKEPDLPVSQRTPDYVRKMDRSMVALQNPPEKVARMHEFTARDGSRDVPIKVYQPHTKVPLPIFIYLHGGGFVIGPESYESPIRAICNRSGYLVCSIHYRLAPENKFPTAVDDAFMASEWIVKNAVPLGGNPELTVIGGDSSGGNLAAVIAHLNKDRSAFRLTSQILIYPMLDATCSQPSVAEFASGYGFTQEKIDWYFNQYIDFSVNKADPRLSPLLADDFSGLPSAFIATAEFDPLRDEGEAYGQRLTQAGVAVKMKRYPGVIHCFLQMTGVLEQSKALIEDIAQELRTINALQ